MRHFFFLLFLSMSALSMAQSGDDDVDQFFDDYEVNSNNIVKFNLTGLYIGEAAFFYERILFDRVGIEAGAGIMLPYYNPELQYTIGSSVNALEEPSGGYSFHVQPKLYHSTAPEGMYYSIYYRHRNYKQNDSSFVYNDIVATSGIQRFITDRIGFDLTYGIGIRLGNEAVREVWGGATTMQIVYPVHLKVSYFF